MIVSNCLGVLLSSRYGPSVRHMTVAVPMENKFGSTARDRMEGGTMSRPTTPMVRWPKETPMFPEPPEAKETTMHARPNKAETRLKFFIWAMPLDDSGARRIDARTTVYTRR